MTFLHRDHPRSHETLEILNSPSRLSCGVCGYHALSEDSPHEYAEVADRSICLICGAHRLM